MVTGKCERDCVSAACQSWPSEDLMLPEKNMDLFPSEGDARSGASMT